MQAAFAYSNYIIPQPCHGCRLGSFFLTQNNYSLPGLAGICNWAAQPVHLGKGEWDGMTSWFHSSNQVTC